MSQRYFNRDNNNKFLFASPNKPILSRIEHKRNNRTNTDPGNISEYSSAFLFNELQNDGFKEDTDYNRASFSRLTGATTLIKPGHLKHSVKEACILVDLLSNNAGANAVNCFRSLVAYLSLPAQTLIKTLKHACKDLKYVENCKNIRFFQKYGMFTKGLGPRYRYNNSKRLIVCI